MIVSPGENMLGKYELIKKLGRGGFGIVYLGKHPHFAPLVAIKVMSDLSPDTIESFRKEAERLYEIKHSNIVRVHGFDIDDNSRPYMLMDYAPNGTLRERHPKGSILSLDTVVGYVKQVASALMYLHEKVKIVHRDVKPEEYVA